MNRKLQRDWVFKFIYQDLFNRQDGYENFIALNDLDGEDFIKKSLISFLENRQKLEDILEEDEYISKNRLSKVDLAILNLSLNEMFFLEIPKPVSINEAVNLAKEYGNETDYKKVNKILGDIVRK